MRDILIIGGGLAGLTSAIILADAGYDVVLYEKKQYPYHKVCGEYVSNEVLPLLRRIGIHPEEFGAATIDKLEISSRKGRKLTAKLDMGGFGISRYVFDDLLARKAKSKGAEIVEGIGVKDITFKDEAFHFKCADGSHGTAKVAIGAYGKRAALDRQLDRPFFRQRSPWLGVKYHVRTDFPIDTIALYNFESGYCGLNKIEDDKYCLCYLAARDSLKRYGDIETMEQELLYRNPLLKQVFLNSEKLYEKPEVINEISFATKTPVENHILMAGDAAGMIAPLFGNGMAMAIHAGKIAAGEIIKYQGHKDRGKLENNYAKAWEAHFFSRMKLGRSVQELYKRQALAEAAIGLLKIMPPLKNFIIKHTHGNKIM